MRKMEPFYRNDLLFNLEDKLVISLMYKNNFRSKLLGLETRFNKLPNSSNLAKIGVRECPGQTRKV